ncbi:MAG TPA: glycosyltransferase family 4 protein [Opitutaceae bacterium]
MNILLVNYEYPPVGAGAATATREIGAALHRMGHKVAVLTSSFEDLTGTRVEDGVKVVRVPSKRRRPDSASIIEMSSFMLHAAAAISAVIRDEAIDAVVCFFSIPGGPVALLAKARTGTPFVVSLRGGDVPGAERSLGLLHALLRPIRRAILKSATAVVANSDGLKDLSEAADPVPVTVIPNGVDSSFFSPLPAAQRPESGRVRLLFVGRFQAQKNLVWMLERLAEVKLLPGSPFVIQLVGDGPQRGEIVAATKALGIQGDVEIGQWTERPRLREHYQRADILLNPSLYEGMPNVVAEAMSCGCPVVASRVPGNESIVEDGRTGWLFGIGDDTGFVRLMRWAIDHPRERHTAGLASRDRITTTYSWDRSAQSYLELLLQSRPNPSLA